MNIPKEIYDEISNMIGHHHHPRGKETLHFQIVYEADWLANLEEKGNFQDREKAEEIIGKVFETVTGKNLAKEIFKRSGHLEEDYVNTHIQA